MRNNPVQFAVVREDPLVEASLLWDVPTAKRVCLVASGGCTALSLQSLFPELQFTVFDLNPSQLDLVRKKFELLHSLKSSDLKSQFNIEDSRSSGINACGNFESLFRGLREFIFEFIIPYGEMRRIFEKENVAEASKERIFTNKYWPVAFDMFFADSFLRTMFGQQAVQHAPAGSYSKFFREQMEKGFQRIDARNNYFLHHIFLGHYLKEDASLPIYLSKPPKELNFEFHLGDIQSLETEIKNFDLISLSNIFDWMDDREVAGIGGMLSKEMKPGAHLVYRQLNHETDFTRHLEGFSFERQREAEIFAKDRSLFYSRIGLGRKK